MVTISAKIEVSVENEDLTPQNTKTKTPKHENDDPNEHENDKFIKKTCHFLTIED